MKYHTEVIQKLFKTQTKDIWKISLISIQLFWRTFKFSTTMYVLIYIQDVGHITVFYTNTDLIIKFNKLQLFQPIYQILNAVNYSKNPRCNEKKSFESRTENKNYFSHRQSFVQMCD